MRRFVLLVIVVMACFAVLSGCSEGSAKAIEGNKHTSQHSRQRFGRRGNGGGWGGWAPGQSKRDIHDDNFEDFEDIINNM
uniref:Uncharacterized protein n=1 Tax=Ciona intestinalis TaxID=7719 RepID=F6PVA6_CIOIN